MKIRVGDVVLVELDPTKGDEKNKTRPCLVVEDGSGTALGLAIVLPITEAGPSRKARLFVEIDETKAAGLSKPSVVDCYQIRSLSTRRIKRRLGEVGDEVLDAVRSRLALILDIGEEHLG